MSHAKALSRISLTAGLLFSSNLALTIFCQSPIVYHRLEFNMTEVVSVVAVILLALSSLAAIVVNICLWKFHIFRTWLWTSGFLFLVQTAAVLSILPHNISNMVQESSLFGFTTKLILSQLELLFVVVPYLFTWFHAAQIATCVYSAYKRGLPTPKEILAKKLRFYFNVKQQPAQ